MDEIESKSVHKIYISVNNNKQKDKKYEEPLVMDNCNIEVIRVPGCFKLFECDKMFLNKLNATYKCAGVGNTKENYLSEMYDTITNYIDHNNTPFSNANIIEAIYQGVLEEQKEANNDTVDTFIPQIKRVKI